MSKSTKPSSTKGTTNRPVDKQTVAMELKYLMINIGRCRLGHIKLPSRLREDLGIDSLNVTEILVAIEQRYGLEISEDEASRTVTFKDLVELITGKLAKSV